MSNSVKEWVTYKQLGQISYCVGVLMNERVCVLDLRLFYVMRDAVCNDKVTSFHEML